MRAITLTVSFVILSSAYKMTDHDLRRLPDGERAKVKQHRYALYVCLRYQLVLGQTVEHDRCDDQLRDIIQRGLHSRRHADLQHSAELPERERDHRFEYRGLLDLCKEDDHEDHAADHPARAGGCRGSGYSHTRYQSHIQGCVEQVHPG